MKSISLRLTGLTAILTSTAVSAHPGEHQDLGLLSGLIHLLSEHALPVAAIALVVGGLLIKRLIEAR
jgi:hypothetical protein